MIEANRNEVTAFYAGQYNADNDDFDEGKEWKSRIEYVFERVICDEAHTLRNPSTYISEGVRQVQRMNTHFLTATPILNHCKDLRGMLNLIWNPLFELYNVAPGFIEGYRAEFDPNQVEINGNTVSLIPPDTPVNEERRKVFTEAIAKGDRVWVLDPVNYATCGNGNGWSPGIMSILLPPILKTFMLRLSMGSVVDLGADRGDHRVGEEVPECNVYTIQLSMNRTQQQEYQACTEFIVKTLYRRKADGNRKKRSTLALDPDLHQDAGVYRWLMHAALDPRLTRLTLRGQGRKSQGAEIRNQWLDIDYDHGASFFYTQTRSGPEYLIPADRLSMATYMASKSVKMQYLLGLLANWVLEEKKKVILVFEYPMCQW